MNPQARLDFVTRHPDEVLEITNDQECKAILLNLGIINDFTRSDGPNMSVVTTSGHPTHWVMGVCWTGYPEDNGYCILFLPKKFFNWASMMEYVNDFTRDQGGTDRQQAQSLRPDDWQKHN